MFIIMAILLLLRTFPVPTKHDLILVNTPILHNPREFILCWAFSRVIISSKGVYLSHSQMQLFNRKSYVHSTWSVRWACMYIDNRTCPHLIPFFLLLLVIQDESGKRVKPRITWSAAIRPTCRDRRMVSLVSYGRTYWAPRSPCMTMAASPAQMHPDSTWGWLSTIQIFWASRGRGTWLYCSRGWQRATNGWRLAL